MAHALGNWNDKKDGVFIIVFVSLAQLPGPWSSTVGGWCSILSWFHPPGEQPWNHCLCGEAED